MTKIEITKEVREYMRALGRKSALKRKNKTNYSELAKKRWQKEKSKS
jgi:hypothetical protein